MKSLFSLLNSGAVEIMKQTCLIKHLRFIPKLRLKFPKLVSVSKYKPVYVADWCSCTFVYLKSSLSCVTYNNQSMFQTGAVGQPVLCH